MAITDQKIGAWTSPVVNEADQPQRTAEDMKAVFDSNSNQIKAKYNALIDALAGTGGADNIGSAAIGDLQEGTVATQLSALLAKFAGYPASSDIKGIRLNSEGRIEVTLDGTQWQLTAQTGDPALDLGALETAQTIDDADGFLMYDASEMKNKRTLWSKIKSVLGSGYALATHAHGSITNDGKIGTAANKAVYTGEGGALQAGTLPVSAGGTGATTSAGALANLGAQAKRLTFTNKTVATSAWASDTTYTDYPYRAAVPCTGVTESMFVQVVLAPEDATGGNFAPVCRSYTGGVYLYAKATPDAEITIPTIVAWG